MTRIEEGASTKATPSLLALSRAASEHSKVIFRRRFFARLTTLALGVGALCVPADYAKVAYMLSIAVLMMELAVWCLNRWGTSKHELGEAARRHAMLTDAFGEAPELEEVIDLRTRFGSGDEARAASLEDPNYYASEAEPGLVRLRENLVESAFYSKSHFRLAAARAWKQLVAVCAIVLLTGWIGLTATEGNTELFIARVVVLLVGGVVAMDVLGRALSWQDAARDSESVYKRLGAAGRKGAKEALAVFGDYFVATSSCAPIPTEIHEKNHDRLSALYEERS